MIPVRRFEPHENRDGSRSSGYGRGVRGFWNKVLRRPDGCWDWMGYLDSDGAGKFTTRVDGKQRTVRAPRWAWEQEHGPVPADHMLLAVVCWNRKCVRPSHRMVIPHADVVRWINALGRPVERADNRGAMCAKAILDEDAVRFIRAQGVVRGSVPLLAKLYGVSKVTVQKAKYRCTWKHIGRAHKGEQMSLAALRDLVQRRSRDAGSIRAAFNDAAVARGEAM